MMEPHHEGAATEPEQPQRKLSQKRAAPERADRGVKKGRLEPLDTQDIPQEAASPAEEQALSTGAVKPETPAKVSTTGHVPCVYVYGRGVLATSCLKPGTPWSGLAWRLRCPHETNRKRSVSQICPQAWPCIGCGIVRCSAQGGDGDGVTDWGRDTGILCLTSRHSLQGMETKPAPGDAGTDSGTDDEAKLQSAAEQGLRIHRSRKAEAVKQKLAAPECTSEAAEALPAQRQAHQAAPESAGESCLPHLCPQP